MAILKYKNPVTEEYNSLATVQGPQGIRGIQGEPGIGISNIDVQTIPSSVTENGKTIITILRTNNEITSFTIPHGEKGADGEDGGISEMSFNGSDSKLNYTSERGDQVSTLINPSIISAGTMETSLSYPLLGIDNAQKLYYNNNVYVKDNIMYGAGWNDYAEHRRVTNKNLKAGQVVYELGDDTVDMTYDRLMPACSIISDTYGFIIGEHNEMGVATAIAGRVLAYPYEDRNIYKPGDAVCSAPEGKVSKMTREEIINYPDRIIGYVSCVPNYETWGITNIEVNNRIWIKLA